MEVKDAPRELSIPLAGGTTPVPTALLDRVMPTLRDTELRVLLVVVRQTLGWQVGKDPRLRKERDWLTQSQLMRRTGRASGAVARAVDTLVRRGLIDVLDKTERPLVTPAERRRCLGRLYYRLRLGKGETTEDRGGSAATKSEHAKPHTTKKTVYKNKTFGRQVVDKSVENSCAVRRPGWTQAGGIRRLCPQQTEQGASAGSRWAVP